MPTLEEEGNPDVVYDALDNLPSFWQNLDAPVDHVMTMSVLLAPRLTQFLMTFCSRNDITCRLGDDPSDVHRADFLTPNPITGKRGYRAWKQGRINPQQVSCGSSWNFDLTEILKSSTPDFSDDVEAMMNNLQSHNLLLDDNRTRESLKLENDACEQLALDLGMSSQVYASKTFSRQDSVPPRQVLTFEDTVVEVSLATGALSINVPGPPPVHFGFLTPITTGLADDDSTNVGSEIEADLVPLGVRLLLDEWRVGEDPKGYNYLDPYGGDGSSQTGVERELWNQSQPTDLFPQLNPPTVVTARAPPLVAPTITTVSKEREGTPLGGGHTQDNPLQTQGSSQDVAMASTQVEPGKFGDRKSGQKKRQKRVGGF